MTSRDVTMFLALAAIWGASFLFMRIVAPVFGPIPLMLLRCAIGAATLLPLLLLLGRPQDLMRNAGHIALVGVLNSAVPFVLLGYATLVLSAGVTSIMNSLAPLWSAAVAFGWLGDRLSRGQVFGLALGIAGVTILVAGGGDVPDLADGKAASAVDFGASRGYLALLLPFLSALGATAFYGLAANYARRHLSGVDPLALATGSQLSASLVLLIPGLLLWPSDVDAGALDWFSVVMLGVLCTGIAYLLFFRLIGSVGATRTIAVTFVIPVFGVGWGALLLDEQIAVTTIAGGAIIVLGTALTTGVLGARRQVARTA